MEDKEEKTGMNILVTFFDEAEGTTEMSCMSYYSGVCE
jgi:hypothetical protein